VFMRMKRYNEAAILAKQAGGLSFDPLLEARRRIFIGDMEVRLGAYQDARAQFWMSLNYDAREYAVRSIDERIARCEFMERWQ
jgi:plasmid maintenance system antidote protein VapI